MLFLVVLSAGLILGAGMMGFMFNRFLSHRARAQAEMDAQALSLASTINVGNRVGQLNNLEQGSRELCYLSRDSYDKCQTEDSAFLAPLCYQLLVEAREGHQLVERERQTQIKSICEELQQGAANYNLNTSGSSSFCWPQASSPRIDRLVVGNISNTDSNVRNLGVLKELVEFDQSNGYINSKSNLYRADINAKLPNEGDLNFPFSSLAANVEGTCSPARVASSNVFKPLETIVKNGKSAAASPSQIPNAVEVQSSMSASAGPDSQAQINMVSVGVTSGDSSK